MNQKAIDKLDFVHRKAIDKLQLVQTGVAKLNLREGEDDSTVVIVVVVVVVLVAAAAGLITWFCLNDSK